MRRALQSFLLLTLLSGFLPALAQTRLIRYSATLPDAAQQAQPGAAVGVIFSIYRDQYDGAPLWSEVQNIHLNKTGSYDALLGSTRNEGLPIELFASPEPRWLEVEINGVKEPRVLLGSVPYAMVAVDAQSLGGLPPSAYLRADAATTTTTTNIIATPAGVKAAFASNGTQGYLSLFTDGAGDLGNSTLFQSTFNSNPSISIGGTTQLGAMTLIGNVPVGDTAGLALYNQGGGGGASVSIDMYNTGANGGIPQAKIKALDDGSYLDHLTFWTKNPGAQNNPVAERMRLTSTGNLGIGTTTPGGKLEVAGNVKISGNGNALVFPDGTMQTTAVVSPTGGVTNTALGQGALANNMGGINVANGLDALQSNTSGSGNTASGSYALQANTTGFFNSASGSAALEDNTTGAANTADGVNALTRNTTGNFNTAVGGAALAYNTGGNYSAAFGASALLNDSTGSFNIGIGANVGQNISGGNYNIMIGNQASSSDDHVIRIGDVQTQTYIAGISGVNVSGVPVVVSSTGQLGIAQSSRVYKEDIHDMADASSGLKRLRPVTYRYKQPFPDGSKPLDYGLIAEEVAEVYPDLVARSQDGKIQTVMYQKLTPMLLNEVQRLQAENAAQTNQLTTQSDKIQKLEERLSKLEKLLSK